MLIDKKMDVTGLIVKNIELTVICLRYTLILHINTLHQL